MAARLPPWLVKSRLRFVLFVGPAAVVGFVYLYGGYGQECKEADGDAGVFVEVPDVCSDGDGADEAEGVVPEEFTGGHFLGFLYSVR